ncbi:MAG TPA: hypothetical protein PKA82_12320 [Pyrinomonadaceae bacterium]|nr:hypothetical protein [Pyrinomonadaceae bacterium]
MSLREKFRPHKCYYFSECRRDADANRIKQLFERDWEVLAFSLDRDSGKYTSMTLCCDAELASPMSVGKAFATSCSR